MSAGRARKGAPTGTDKRLAAVPRSAPIRPASKINRATPARLCQRVRLAKIGQSNVNLETANQSHFHPADARFQALTENLADCITVVDPTGVILYDSPNRNRYLGIVPGELDGTNALELVHPDDRPQAARLLGELCQNPAQPCTAELRLRHKDGSWRAVEVIGKNLLANPAVAGIVLNSRDITAHKQVEQELRQRVAELKTANEQLQTFNRLVIGRELRMIELKKEINQLCVAAGQPRRYETDFDKVAE